MASFKTYPNGKCVAYVERQGIRKSKTLPDINAARAWAEALERKITSHKDVLDAAASRILASMIPKRVLQASAAVPYNLEEVLQAALPAQKHSGIYFLIENMDVSYVGQSVDVFGRVSRHKRDGRTFDSFAYILCDKSELDRLEMLYIEAFVPWLNRSI